MAYPRVLQPPFVRKRIKRIALLGDSRIAGSSLNQTANYVWDYSPLGAIATVLNIALGGRAVVINPGETFTSNNTSIPGGNAYMGFSVGALGYDGLTGHLKEAIKHKPDCVVLALGYNDLTATGTVTTRAIARMQWYASSILESGIPYVMLCTVWGPGSKDQGAIDAYNVGVRAFAAQLGDRCILMDQGAKYTASPATYFTPSESPQVHWSVTGQDTFVADIVSALTPYLASDTAGWPIVESDFTYKTEAGILFRKDFSSWSFTGDTAQAWSLTGVSGLAANSNSGACATSSVTSSLCSGNRMTFALTSGATAYNHWQTYGLQAISGISTGDRIAVCCGFQADGLIAGSTTISSTLYLSQYNTGTGSVTAAGVMSFLQTNAFLGQRGVMYAEFTADAPWAFFSPKFQINQADNLGHTGAPGAYAGSFTLDNFSVVNLTTLARAYGYMTP
jgi:hypothetical protein